jgi:hypothetical protein
MTESSSTAELEHAFNQLKKDFSSRSKTGIIRLYFQEIEELKSTGIPNLKIVECLNHAGIAITLKVFESLLYRIRHRNSVNPAKEPPKPSQQEVHTSIRDPPTIRIENQGDIRRVLNEVIKLENYL